jgi:hypothetical protein
MRNLAYFLVGFIVICLIGLSTGCSMPLRKPEPYEKRQQHAQRDKTEWEQIEDYVAAKKRDSAVWWNCTRRNPVDEC